MDLISYQKASKAKKEIKLTQDRLGLNETEQGLDIRDIYTNVDERISELEKKNPEVKLYNQVSDVSAHTMINLNKHNLRISSLLNQARYSLSDMIVDDFIDDSGIDKSMSVNYLYDSLNNIIKIAEGESQAEIVTVVEEVQTVPSQIVVSQATIEQHLKLQLVNFEEGMHDNTVINGNNIELKKIGQYESPDFQNLIPKMTSDTSPEGFVFASSYYSNRYPWLAFNHDASDFWNSSRLNNYVGYKFTEPKKIEEIAITARNDTTPDRTPSEFIIQSSSNTTDGTDGEWNDIAHFRNENNWSLGERRVYSLDNDSSFIAYRILVLNSVRSDYPSIAELEFLGKIIKDIYVPNGAYESNTVDLGSSPKSIHIYTDEQSLVPLMKSYTDPEGLVFASSYYTHNNEPRYPWLAFNQEPTDFWNSVSIGNYIGYKFTTPKVVTKISMTARNDSRPDRTPSSFLVQASNDTTDGHNGNWIDIQRIYGETDWALGETREFDIDNSHLYRAYRVKVLSAEMEDFPTISKLHFIGYGVLDSNNKNVHISISSSLDNVSFSDYEPISSGGSINSPNRFIKIKVELAAEGEKLETLVHDFTEEEKADFEENNFIEFDEAAKLKTSYSDPMEVDTYFTGEGALLKKAINKIKFKAIEKVEVIK
ncbi:MAG: hypothetical protein IKF29_04675 [Oceanobacillus sp.]|nr:hypothetical protein [Oceanobacillus sp.]